MSTNNKIGAKFLKNLHLNLNEKGILEDVIEIEEVSSDEEKDEKEKEEKGEKMEEEEDKAQETIPSANANEAEGCSQSPREEAQERKE
jgi:hypothetical protein